MKVWQVLLIILVILIAVLVVLYFLGKRAQKKQEETPKLMRRTKLPIVKAKIGPRIMTMVADEKIFDLIPLKKEVKATISGIYITDVRGVRGPLEQPKQKEKFFRRMKNKIAKKDK